MAAKKTADLIPLCHPLALTKVTVDIEPDAALPGLRVAAEAKVSSQTGVEMEALTAVSVACLTIYDMLKAADRTMHIEGIALVENQAADQAFSGAAIERHGCTETSSRGRGAGARPRRRWPARDRARAACRSTRAHFE